MNRKTMTFLAAAAAIGATSAATAAVQTASTINSWTGNANAIIAAQSGNAYIIGSGITGDPTPLAFSVSGSGSSPFTSGSIGGGGFYYAGVTLGASNGTWTTSGSNLVFTASGVSNGQLTFTMNANVWGIALQYSVGPSSNEAFVQSNGAPSLFSSSVATTGGGGWLGITNDTGGGVSVVNLTISAGQSITFVGAQYLMVPAPGAVALVGLAGLVGGPRRRR